MPSSGGGGDARKGKEAQTLVASILHHFSSAKLQFGLLFLFCAITLIFVRVSVFRDMTHPEP